MARELARFHTPKGLADRLNGLLDEEEIDWLAMRMQDVLREPVLPVLRSRWEVPWPLV